MLKSKILKDDLVLVNVKWGKETYNVECDTNEKPIVFK